MSRLKLSILILVCFCMLIDQAFAQTADAIRLNDALRPYLNSEGKLTPEALAKINGDLEKAKQRNARKTNLSPLRNVESPQPAIANARPRQAPSAPPLTPTSNIQSALLLRDAYSPVAFVSEDWSLSAKGASFTYMDDRRRDTYTIVGKGALFYAVYGDLNINAPNFATGNPTRITHFAFVPGVEWNVTDKRNTVTKGSVAARAGLELTVRDGPIVESEFWRFHAIHTTDVATNTAKLFSFETSWQPTDARLFLGESFQLSRPLGLWMALIPSLNADYLYAGETSGFTNLAQKQDYLWVGPKVALEAFFVSGPLQNVGFSAKYFYLPDVINGSRTTVEYFQASTLITIANYASPLDPQQTAKISLEFTYTEGKTPRTLELESSFYAGLSIKLGDIAKK